MSRRGGRPGTRAGSGDGDWVENALVWGRLGEIWCWAALAPADPLRASATCGILAKDGDLVLFPTDEVVKDTQPEDDRQLESQARASEEPQVTDAELNHLTLGQETRAPPPSQAGQPPAEPGVYAALATH